MCPAHAFRIKIEYDLRPCWMAQLSLVLLAGAEISVHSLITWWHGSWMHVFWYGKYCRKWCLPKYRLSDIPMIFIEWLVCFVPDGVIHPWLSWSSWSFPHPFNHYGQTFKSLCWRIRLADDVWQVGMTSFRKYVYISEGWAKGWDESKQSQMKETALSQWLRPRHPLSLITCWMGMSLRDLGCGWSWTCQEDGPWRGSISMKRRHTSDGHALTLWLLHTPCLTKAKWVWRGRGFSGGNSSS